LMDKPDWMIEAEVVMANTHGARNRAFDCSESGFPSCR
jgi:hypothetical protein